ncbi:hypothetical protein CgunFtcFv8_010742 [Champsocephalus gunnari]|uniref:PIH1 N-terminal domain-containing protein n=1 Tax=Champsocephalus gunnari TaxID=52237 RepID=A0AAN8DUI1_CHAGU|nr:hypothetical protein CgunFtcFv8_010742 [Champsocephalus gunnari]
MSGSTGDVLQQVNQFWSILDDLSQNDPAAYRELIEKQMKEGAGFSAPPELDSCIRTEMLEPKKGSLYINICSWKRVPAPQDPSRPLPVCAGKLETDENEGICTVLDVAFNPAVLQESKKDKTEVYMLTLSFAQQHLGMRLSQEYTVVSCSPKSNPEDLHRRLGFRQWPYTSSKTDTASQTPADLLQQITALRSEKQHQGSGAQIDFRPAEQIKYGFDPGHLHHICAASEA